MTLERTARRVREIARVVSALALERASTGVVFNPLGPRQRHDPYPFYRALRERDPVHRSRAAFGWVVSRHEDVLALLRDERCSADDRHFSRHERVRAERIRDGILDPTAEPAPTMLRLDPPDHTRLRGLVNKAFTPRAVAALRGRIESVTRELLDRLGTRDRFDVIAELAVPLPVTIIAEMLGVPAADRETFKRWSDVLVGFLDPQAASAPAIMRGTLEELFAYVGRIAAARRTEPRDDLLTALVQAEDAGDRLDERELYGTVALLLAAGNETTTNAIGNGLLALLRHPEELARLRADPDLAERAVEELLRYDSPVQLTGRVAKEDMEFRGRHFRRGQNVVLLLGSANRDPAVFVEPDRLDLGRTDNRHLSFGHGPHYCLGAELARLETRVVLTELLARFPRLRLAEDRVHWGHFLFLRGPRALPVAV